MRKFLLFPVLTFASVVCASPVKLAPEYELHFKNAAHLRTALKENLWLKNFQSSPLYDGLMSRLGPVLFTLGNNNGNAWEGRLLDYLYDRFLQEKPITLAYYHHPRLVSGMGILVKGLGSTEKALLETLMDKVRAGGLQHVELKEEIVSVTPIRVKVNKFAAVLKDDCLSLSREPRIAAALSLECGEKISEEGLVSVDIKEFFSPWYPLLHGFVGTNRSFTLTRDERWRGWRKEERAGAWLCENGGFHPTAASPWQGRSGIYRPPISMAT